jgi:glycosyltransferase involved in cell wall biosynthesis
MLILLTGNTCFKIANFREGMIRALKADGHEVMVLAPSDDYGPKLQALGVTLHNLPMDRNGTSPIAEALLLWRIFVFLWRERPGIVFGFTIKNNIYAGLACRWLGIPFIPNVTGLGPAFNSDGLLNRTIQLAYQLAFARALAVFFQNPDDRAEFLRRNLVSEACAKLLPGSGVDLQTFRATPMPQADRSLVFLLVARMLQDKGVGLFVEAARELRKIHPQVEFQLLGPIDEDSRSAIPHSQIKTWQNAGYVTYLGKTQDVRPALSAAHCIVLPSWYREGTPRVLLEAAAIGRPVITTDMPGCRDAVVADITGFLCVPQDVESLMAQIRRFIEMSGPERAAMGVAARELAETAFGEDIVIRAYMQQLPEKQP